MAMKDLCFKKDFLTEIFCCRCGGLCLVLLLARCDRATHTFTFDMVICHFNEVNEALRLDYGGRGGGGGVHAIGSWAWN